jgi:predicted transcriptional regulator
MFIEFIRVINQHVQAAPNFVAVISGNSPVIVLRVCPAGSANGEARISTGA